MIRPALRRGLAENAVARRGVSIALACRTFDVDLCPKFPPALRGVLGVKSLALGSSNGEENQKLFGLIMAPNISVASC